MNKRILAALLAITMVLCLVSCTQEQPPTTPEESTTAEPTTTTTTAPQKTVMYVTADVLNVRQAPTTESAVLGQIRYGDVVEILAAEGDWYSIVYQEGTGYVHGDYVVTDPAVITTTTTTEATTTTTTQTSTTRTTASTTKAPTKTTGQYPDASVPPLQGGLTEAERNELYDNLRSIVKKYGSDYKSIYNYVHDHKTYRNMAEGKSIEQMAYRTLKSKSVSCYYFAAFTYLLMQQAGYEVEFVRGLGWQNGTEHCWIMFKEADGWYFMDSLYVRSAKLTAKQCREIGYKWNHTVHPEAK